MLSRQHVNGLLSLALSAPPVLPLGGLIALLLEVVKYSLMYVNEIHSWGKEKRKATLSHSSAPPALSFFFYPSLFLSLCLSLLLR